jgi:hypothetical protein
MRRQHRQARPTFKTSKHTQLPTCWQSGSMTSACVRCPGPRMVAPTLLQTAGEPRAHPAQTPNPGRPPVRLQQQRRLLMPRLLLPGRQHWWRLLAAVAAGSAAAAAQAGRRGRQKQSGRSMALQCAGRCAHPAHGYNMVLCPHPLQVTGPSALSSSSSSVAIPAPHMQPLAAAPAAQVGQQRLQQQVLALQRLPAAMQAQEAMQAQASKGHLAAVQAVWGRPQGRPPAASLQQRQHWRSSG